MRGFYTGLVMGMDHPEDLATLLSRCLNGIKECAMIHAEFQQVFADLEERGLFGEAIYNEDATMELLTEASMHIAVTNLRHLYTTMPREATKLGIAFGMLFALRLWSDHPGLAQHLVDCERTRDEADAPDADSAPEDQASFCAFDQLAMLAFPIFYNETRAVEDRVKDAICGGLIVGLKETRGEDGLQILLAPSASADTAFGSNVSDTAALAAVFVNGSAFAEAMAAKPGSPFPAEVIASALCQLMLHNRTIEREPPKSTAYEGLCRGLVFALVLWRDHPRIASRLAESTARRTDERRRS
jgi:tetrahydromethanopterin S-methyltransferase subunit F